MGTSRSEETLFRLVTKKFAKTIGGPNLLPVPNVNAGHMLSPLGIVVKRPTKKKWFRRSKYEYTIRQTKITNLLEDESDLDVKMTEIESVLNCGSSDCTNVNASSGFSVLKTFFARFKPVKYKCHSFTTGRTKAGHVEKKPLMEVLQNRKINVNDPEIRQILQVCKDSILCVVVSVIRTTERMDILEETKTGVEGDLKIDMPDGSGSGDLSLGREHKSCLELSIDPTVLAYNVCELEVDMTTGEITVILEPELRGGFKNFSSTIDAIEFMMVGPSESYMHSLYETMNKLTPEERNIVREVVRTPADDADIICQILYQRDNYKDLNDSFLRSNSFCSTNSDSTGYDTDVTLQSNDDVPLQLQSLSQAGSFEDGNDSGAEMGLPDMCKSMSVSACSTTSGSSGFSEHASPTNDVNSPIKTSATDDSILSLTTKPLAFRKLLQQVLGWSITDDGTMIQPEDKSRMDLFECFFVLLKRLHHENSQVIEDIYSLSSRTRNALWEVFRQTFVPRDEGRNEERRRKLREEFKQLEVETRTEEFATMERLYEFLDDVNFTRIALFSILLALS